MTYKSVYEFMNFNIFFFLFINIIKIKKKYYYLLKTIFCISINILLSVRDELKTRGKIKRDDLLILLADLIVKATKLYCGCYISISLERFLSFINYLCTDVLSIIFYIFLQFTIYFLKKWICKKHKLLYIFLIFVI